MVLRIAVRLTRARAIWLRPPRGYVGTELSHFTMVEDHGAEREVRARLVHAYRTAQTDVVAHLAGLDVLSQRRFQESLKEFGFVDATDPAVTSVLLTAVRRALGAARHTSGSVRSLALRRWQF